MSAWELEDLHHHTSTYRSVKVPAGGHIKDATAHGQVNRLLILAVELDQRLGGVDTEDRWGRPARELDRLLGAEVPVHQHDEERGEDEVDWRCDRHTICN